MLQSYHRLEMTQNGGPGIGNRPWRTDYHYSRSHRLALLAPAFGVSCMASIRSWWDIPPSLFMFQGESKSPPNLSYGSTTSPPNLCIRPFSLVTCGCFDW